MMNLRVCAVFSCLLLLTGWHGFAQQAGQKFGHIYISTDQGLSQSVINCIFQDSRGYIWAGTQQGLHKYDGYSFTSYLHDESNPASISGNTIRCIYEDAAGHIWVGTDGKGLNLFDRNTETFQTYTHQGAGPSSLLDNTVTAITEDKQGELWIGTRSGLQTFRDGTFRTQTLLPQKYTVNYLREDRTQNLWVSTDNGLFRLGKNRRQPERFAPLEQDSNSISRNEVNCIFETKEGEILAGTHAGLTRFNPGTRSFEKYTLSSPHANLIAESEIYALAQDQASNLWMGTFGNGLIKLNLKNNEATVYTHTPDEKEGISSDVILSLLVDRSGLLWAGTYEGILETINPLAIHFGKITHDPADPNSLPNNEVYAIYEDQVGNRWTGTDNGLCLYDQKTHTYTVFKNDPGNPASLSSTIVYSILQDSDGNLWVGTARGGLNKVTASNFKKGTFQFEHFSPAVEKESVLSSGDILCLFEDKSHRIWVGTSDGLSVIDRQNTVRNYWHDPQKTVSLSGNEILSVLQDKSGVIWVGTNQGLNRFNPENGHFQRFINKKNPLNLSDNTIYSMHEDADGYLWLGTDGGLCNLDPQRKKFTIYTVNDGLPDNVVYGILEDKEHNLWCSTNKGLSKVKKSNHAQEVTFINYNEGNWLHCNAFNIGAYHQSNSGILYFGCNEGISFFDPANVAGNRYIPPVVITDFELFFEPVKISDGKTTPLSKAISETKELVLKYNQNVLYFEFAGLNFIDNARNEYAFFMEGFDKDWNYPKDYRNATYTNLDPGTYTFRVKASNNDGVWNEEGTALKLIITPPYYRENWFYGICALGFFFSIFGYVRYRTHELKKNEQILVQKVTERTEEVNRQKEELETTLENLKATQAQLVQAEKMASLGILTAGVAHEINNPINFVSANVEPLRRDIQDVLQIMAAYEKTIEQYTLREKFGEVEALKKELDYELLIDEINHLLRGIKEGATRTSEIVKGLRSFSRLDENAMKALNVNEGIESTLLVLANQLKNKTIVKELGPVDELMGYPGKLNQVFMNVLSNACQAITGKGEIRITTGMDNGNVVIRIADNGIGMTEEVQKRIFEPFFTTKKVGAGTGLGQSISYGIIKAHNGTIAVESAPGKGTAFTITIPVNKIPSL